MACAFVVSATTLLIPLCANYITKNVLASSGPDTVNRIWGMGTLMLGLIGIHTLGNMFVAYQGHMMGANMEHDMRRELFDHYQKLSFAFYDEQKVGQLMTRLTNDSFDLAELFHHGPEDIVISTLNFIGAFAILVSINAKLALVVFLFLPLMTLYAIYFNRKMKEALRRSHDRIGDINSQVEDSLAGIRVVKSFTNELVEAEKFAGENGRFLASRRDTYRSETYFYEGLVAFTQLITVAVIVFGGVTIVKGTLDLPELITFLLCVAILIEPIHRYGNFTRLYQEGIAGFERFMEVLEVQPDILDAPDASEPGPVQGSITFKNVSFTYRDESGYVFRNLSLDIQAGEFVALVGPSGIGKTTFCSLIPRFYEVKEGEVLLDGRNIKELRLETLRRNIGLVQQDVYLFAGTVADNIRYGKVDASDAEIVAAAKKANAHEFIMALPNGYHTDIGQRGVKLSGGQKQRLSIARVFLKDPPVLIFDEATSALDNESEKAIQASLEQLANDRTTIVIAHRLSTVRNAQRIVVLTEEGIDEQGSHEDLMTSGGTYANLYKLQLSL
ncbi:MAG: ABC transporter ATP-binding protein [Ardenticatenaceae bacterium]|nr:ABC transporter ATP-binding protein [Ardenticatenaceae bacterium]MCB8975137.1 ABC transporter ATP-binding protein [Ardenticatenaceae bacterium]